MFTSTTANPSSVAIGADPALRAGRVGVAVPGILDRASGTARPAGQANIDRELGAVARRQVAVTRTRDALVVDLRARWRGPVRHHGHRARGRAAPCEPHAISRSRPDAAEDRAPERSRRQHRHRRPAPVQQRRPLPPWSAGTYTCWTLPPTVSLVAGSPPPRPRPAASQAHRQERRREQGPPELFAHSEHLWSRSTLQHRQSANRCASLVPSIPRQETGSLWGWGETTKRTSPSGCGCSSSA